MHFRDDSELLFVEKRGLDPRLTQSGNSYG
jgi:hypothetical protein